MPPHEPNNGVYLDMQAVTSVVPSFTMVPSSAASYACARPSNALGVSNWSAKRMAAVRSRIEAKWMYVTPHINLFISDYRAYLYTCVHTNTIYIYLYICIPSELGRIGLGGGSLIESCDADLCRHRCVSIFRRVITKIRVLGVWLMLRYRGKPVHSLRVAGCGLRYIYIYIYVCVSTYISLYIHVYYIYIYICIIILVH
jgi:hypothetical protein